MSPPGYHQIALALVRGMMCPTARDILAAPAHHGEEEVRWAGRVLSMEEQLSAAIRDGADVQTVRDYVARVGSRPRARGSADMPAGPPAGHIGRLALDAYRHGVSPVAREVLAHPERHGTDRVRWAEAVVMVEKELRDAVGRGAGVDEIGRLIARVSDVPRSTGADLGDDDGRE